MSDRFFASDNASGVHPEVMAAIASANAGHAVGYGDDPWTASATKALGRVFGRKSSVYFVYNGTGANVLGIQSALRAHNAVICTDCSHINVDECGAVERFTGAKLLPVPSPSGRLDPARIEPLLSVSGVPHHSQPRVVSITQATEVGTVYSVDEIRELSRFCRRHDLVLHMDGARISNAAVSLGLGLYEASGKLGVDILSLGGTKNGLMFGEAVVFFRSDLADEFEFIRKQGTQLASKMRYIAAGFEALFATDLWERNARHANEMATYLCERLDTLPEVEVVQPVHANGCFVKLPQSAIPRVRKSFFFYVWDEPLGVVRFMCSYDTTREDVDALVAAIGDAVGGVQ
ncbi:MAG: low specificity L-threonine aldolase [Spirochaetaceae bacterium]|nr:MAG: low specificity L-threonine aldolase [Spirochaetaceae bacterium]